MAEDQNSSTRTLVGTADAEDVWKSVTSGEKTPAPQASAEVQLFVHKMATSNR